MAGAEMVAVPGRSWEEALPLKAQAVHHAEVDATTYAVFSNATHAAVYDAATGAAACRADLLGNVVGAAGALLPCGSGEASVLALAEQCAPSGVLRVLQPPGPQAGGGKVEAMARLGFTPTGVVSVSGGLLVTGAAQPFIVTQVPVDLKAAPLHAVPVRPQTHPSALSEPLTSAAPLGEGMFVTADAAGVVRLWRLPSPVAPDELGSVAAEACVLDIPKAATDTPQAVFASALCRHRGFWLLHAAQGRPGRRALSLVCVGGAGEAEVRRTLDGPEAQGAFRVVTGRNSGCDALVIGERELRAVVVRERGEETVDLPADVPPDAAVDIPSPQATAQRLGLCFLGKGGAGRHVAVLTQTGAVVHALAQAGDVLPRTARTAARELVGQKAPALAGMVAAGLPADLSQATADLRFLLEVLLRCNAMHLARRWVEGADVAQPEGLGVVRTMLLWLNQQLHNTEEDLGRLLRVLSSGEWAQVNDDTHAELRRKVPQLRILVAALMALPSRADPAAMQLPQDLPRHKTLLVWLADRVEALGHLRRLLFRPSGRGGFVRDNRAFHALQTAQRRICDARQSVAVGQGLCAEAAFGCLTHVLSAALGSPAARDAAGEEAELVVTLRAGWAAVRGCAEEAGETLRCPAGLEEKLRLVGADVPAGDSCAPPLVLPIDVLYAHATLRAEPLPFVADAAHTQLADLQALFAETREPCFAAGQRVTLSAPVGTGWRAGVVECVNADDTLDLRTADGQLHPGVPSDTAEHDGVHLAVPPAVQRLLSCSVFYLYLVLAFGDAPGSPAERYARTVAGLPLGWTEHLSAVHHASFGTAVRPLAAPAAEVLDALVGSAAPQEGGDASGRSASVAAVRSCAADVAAATTRALWALRGTAELARPLELGGAGPAGEGPSVRGLLHVVSLTERGEAAEALDEARRLRLCGQPGGSVVPAVLMCYALEHGRDWRGIVGYPLTQAEEAGLLLALQTLAELQGADRAVLKDAGHADVVTPLRALLHATGRDCELYAHCLRAPSWGTGANPTALRDALERVLTKTEVARAKQAAAEGPLRVPLGDAAWAMPRGLAQLGRPAVGEVEMSG